MKVPQELIDKIVCFTTYHLAIELNNEYAIKYFKNYNAIKIQRWFRAWRVFSDCIKVEHVASKYGLLLLEENPPEYPFIEFNNHCICTTSDNVNYIVNVQMTSTYRRLYVTKDASVLNIIDHFKRRRYLTTMKNLKIIQTYVLHLKDHF
jgi:hypothetical protein